MIYDKVNKDYENKLSFSDFFIIMLIVSFKILFPIIILIKRYDSSLSSF